jgi:nitroreductase
MAVTPITQVVLEALRARRSMPKVAPQRPPRELIEQIIDAAIYAPNHHKTEPWRFVVMSGGARQALGEVMAQSLARTLPETSSNESKALLAKERDKPLRAPVVIAVAAVPSTEPKVIEIEESHAVAAAVQNMLLAAEALGLGAMWRTGKPAYDPAVKRFLGFPEHAHIVAFVYVGYPALPELPRPPRKADAYTIWLSWE